MQQASLKSLLTFIYATSELMELIIHGEISAALGEVFIVLVWLWGWCCFLPLCIRLQAIRRQKEVPPFSVRVQHPRLLVPSVRQLPQISHNATGAAMQRSQETTGSSVCPLARKAAVALTNAQIYGSPFPPHEKRYHNLASQNYKMKS